MKYFLEKNQSWTTDPDKWVRCTGYNDSKLEFDDLDRAIQCMKKNYTDLTRWIWAMRIMDEQGHLCCVYDPERDMRLPGCKGRRIQRDAYFLWEQAGSPESAGDYFWHQAELNLKDSDGVFEVEGEYVWNRHLKQN